MTRNEFIFNSLKDHNEELKSLNKHSIGIFLQGSQNYNLDIYTDNYKSDVDTKAILVPSLKDICDNKQPISTTHIRKNNEHIDLKDIRLMFENFKKQNINYLEILFTPFYIIDENYKEYFNEINKIKNDFAHSNMILSIKSIYGMAMEKYKALEHPYPTLIEKINKYGYDGKQLSHIIRLYDFILKFVDKKPYEECLNPDKENIQLIMDAKLNKFSLEDARKLAVEYIEKIKNIKDNWIASNEIIINQNVINKMDEIKSNILFRAFKEEIVGENK